MKAETRIYEVELRGTELSVEVNYYEGDTGDYYTPETTGDIEIESILIKGTDIDVTELLCNDYVEIEEFIYYEYYD